MASAATSIQTLVPVGRGSGAAGSGGPGRRRHFHPIEGVGEGVGAGLRPRGVGEILDAGCDVLARRFGAVVLLGFALWLPVRALMELTLRSPAAPLAGFLNLAPVFLVTTAMVAMIARLVSEEVQGREVTLGASVREGLDRILGLAFLTALVGVLAGVGAVVSVCCLGVAGYVVQWLFSVAPAVYVLERASFSDSLSRSMRLVTRSFWRWMGWFVVHQVMLVPISMPAGILDQPEFRQGLLSESVSGGTAFAIGYVVVTALVMGVTSGFSSILMVVFYLDTLVRREGRDLELGLERLEARRAA